MDRLEIPLELSGHHIHGDQGVAEQVRALTVDA